MIDRKQRTISIFERESDRERELERASRKRMSNEAVIELKRMDNTQPWGFRLKGGVDQGLPLHIEHVRIEAV